MFQNDVTKNYELQDATAEILLMLAGAFLLGFLFCWALRKLRGDSDYPQNNRYDTTNHKTRFNPNDASSTQKDNSNSLLKGAAGAAIGTAGAIGGSIASTGSSVKDMAGDVSHKIADSGSSLLDSASDTLNTAGDKLSDAGSSLTDSVSDAVSTAGDKLGDVGSSITETVSDTVGSAGDKLSDIGSDIKNSVTNTADVVGDKLSSTDSSLTEATISDAVISNDNFKKIEGVGPKIEAVLYSAGINTYADLRASDTETLRNILDSAGPAFKMHDPETWPYQADLAHNEKWDKLKEYQDFLMGSED